MTRSIRVRATQEHINRAREALLNEGTFNMCVCPIAQAFMERFNTNEVYALACEIRVRLPDRSMLVYIPRYIEGVHVFMNSFDREEPVAPRSFLFDFVEEQHDPLPHSSH